jgi:asparagine synthase (glutamine-hydrolysing)
MRVKIDLETFAATHDGACRSSAAGIKTLIMSAGLELGSVDELAQAEYGQAVEVDVRERVVRFGRDYLGHCPLLYACTAEALYIGDDLAWIVAMLRRASLRLTLSEQAIALYLSMGYVPAGRTIFNEVVACEPHAVYRWRRGSIDKTSTFVPVEVDASCGLPDLEKAIEAEVERWARSADEIDVWCSGGIDSSIMACLFNAGGRRAQLLTFGYGRDIHEQHGDGERSFAYEVARQCGAPIREIALTAPSFQSAHERFVSAHHMPVIDTCVPPKYALAQASRGLVITGEGSDPLFGGPKNNAMMFAENKGASVNLGLHYARLHDRAFSLLGPLMRRGTALSDYVVEYMNGLLGRYPGDLVRRLFYVNTHIKAASLIFTESYYACRENGVAARHPYAALQVYRTAFALEDRFKYRYPNGKLALHALYASRLPPSIVNRRKSGTVVPLSFYLRGFAAGKFDLAPLREAGLFDERFIGELVDLRDRQADPMLLYALVTLSEWLKHCSSVAPASEDPFQPVRKHGAVKPRAATVEETPC